MDDVFQSIEEVVKKWNVTPRSLQYMCKQGKIPNAVKKNGKWRIPANAPIPRKNNRASATQYEFVGTKKKIFNCAIELFMMNGYGCVTIREIAQAAGITQSALYNHFRSKQHILNGIYDWYCHYYVESRPSLEALEPIIQDGGLLDIINSAHYDFKEEPLRSLQYITRIIFQRVSIDERARNIAKTLMMDEGVRFVEAVFDRAVEMGRLAPLDTHAMAVFINSVRIFTLHSWIIDDTPENVKRITEDEKTLYKYSAVFLTDLGSAGNRNNGAIRSSR